VARSSKAIYQTARPKNRGGFGWLILFLLVAGGLYLLLKREHSAKAASHVIMGPAVNLPAKAPVFKTPPAPLVITPQSPSDFPRPVHDVLEAQIALARRAISPGSIDGALGSQTSAALSVFQDTEDLPVTGELDDATRAKLTLDLPILTNYLVTTNDLASIQPLGKTWLAKSQQSALAYETELELVAEKSHSSPFLIQRLNPNVDWTNITAGTVLKIPDVQYPDPDTKAAFVVIHLADRYLEAYDEDTNLILHFPCSIARRVEKRPVGELHVVVVIQNPNYTVDPQLFPESDELQKIGHKVILPPGPRNPVGVAWMGLDKPGYGMHGTPNAQQVGRTESHGCFRLANWDAEYLSQLVWVGMPVEVEP
jgi:lipoprotein-anchoring transpeptidase ErfK/SrfK